jgi:hypothetical protein
LYPHRPLRGPPCAPRLGVRRLISCGRPGHRRCAWYSVSTPYSLLTRLTRSEASRGRPALTGRPLRLSTAPDLA